MALTSQINIGPVVAKQLHKIGIDRLHQLKSRGAVRAYVEMSHLQPERHLPFCYYLYSLEGAIVKTHWRNLNQRKKDDLKRQALSMLVDQ